MQKQDSITQGQVVVVGDVMLDEYIMGTVTRVSPESCCPILLKQNSQYQLGGAANVAYQLSKLGREVVLFGIVGNDSTSHIMQKLLKECNVVSHLFEHNICTTKKTRFINDVMQQMFRFDEETYEIFSESDLNTIHNYIICNYSHIDCIVLSDYNKGVLDNHNCQSIINLANKLNIASIVDIKVQTKERYIGATVIKGNKKEITSFFNNAGLPRTETELQSLKDMFMAEAIIITEGKDGIAMFNDNGYYHTSSRQVSVYDVTGAGDVVTAYLAYLHGTMPLMEIIDIANIAASIKVGRLGNSHVKLKEITSNNDKIIELEDFLSISRGKRIAFTNGCFDILHAGHVELLHYAKTKGDLLVVALNSDESIKRLKGNKRPVNNFELRATVLSAIEDVDYIIKFEEDTPLDLIKKISPYALIKGGDYSIDTIVGSNYVLSYGGIVCAMPITYDISTTQILRRHELE